MDPEVLKLLNMHNQKQDNRNKNGDGGVQAQGGNGNHGGLRNIKFNVNYKNRQETLRKRFSGNDRVSDVAQAIADEITGGADSSGGYGKKTRMNLVFGKKAPDMNDVLSSIGHIKGNEEWNHPIHVSFKVIGGAYDEKNNGDRVRLAHFQTEKRIIPTLEPDCIYGYNEKKLRVKMPCGHVFDSQSIFKLTQMYVNNLSKSEIKCPMLKCKQVWEFDIVVAAADLDENEIKSMRAAMDAHKTAAAAGNDLTMLSNCLNNSNDSKENGSGDNEEQAPINFLEFCQITKGNCCGLRNLGNTCFMNSALQCLMHSPHFSQELLGFVEKQVQEHNEAEIKRINDLKEAAKRGAEEGKKFRKKWESSVKVNDAILVQFKSDPRWYHGVITKIIGKRESKNGKVCVNFICDHDGDERNHFGWNLGSKSIKPDTDTDTDTDVDDDNGGMFQDFLNAGRNTYNKYLGLGGSDSGIITEKIRKFSFSRNNILEEWMYLLYEIHYIGNYNCIAPREFKRFLCEEDNQFYGNDQHDAYDALLTSLNGMKNVYDKMLNKLGYKSAIKNVKTVPIELNESVFDCKAGDVGDVGDDEKYLSRLQSKGYLVVENAPNLITRHFGSIQVTSNTCMNCGFGNRIYELSNSIEVPVSNECIKLTLLKYDNKSNGYVYALNSVNIVLNGKIKLAKFYGLYFDSRKNVQDIQHFDQGGSCTELDKWDILAVNRINSKGDKKIITILNDDQRLEGLISSRNYSCSCLLMVPNEIIFNSNLNDSCFKLVVCYVLDSFDTTVKHGKRGDNGSKVSVYFSVLKIPLCKRDMNYKELACELAHTGQYKSITSHGKRKYRMIFNIDGIKYDGKNNERFVLNKKIGNIICILKESSVFTAQFENTKRILKECKSNGAVWKEINRDLFSDSDSDSKYISDKMAMKRLDNEISRLEKNKIHFENQIIEMIDKTICINENNMKEFERKQENRLTTCKNYKCLFEMKLSDRLSIETALKKFESAYNINRNYKFVELIEKSLRDIDDCIDLYYQVSYVSSSTFEMKCQCKKLNYQFKYAPIVCIKKELLNSPNILILKFDRGDASAYKTSHRIKFNTQLKLEQLNEKYSLFGVSCHSGSNNGGHYTARVKKLGTNNDWYDCNDQSVSSRYPNSNNFCDNAIFLCFSKEYM